MIFTDLQDGESVFLDANTLIYYSAPHPVFGPACRQLIQRIENHQLHGFTAPHVLSEVAHRMMTIEASTLLGWPMAGIAYRLQRHPAEVQRLTHFRQAIEDILQSRLQVLTTAGPLIAAATGISQQTGLLSNDALIVAVMQANGLTNLASHDDDFDRVPGLTRYAPV